MYTHAIFISDFFINELRKAKHMYIDCTFIKPKDFKQVLIILYYNDLIYKNFPASFILLNNKREKSYYIVLKYLYELIKFNLSVKLDLITYSTDFEPGLFNTCKKVFGENIRAVGYLFHFGQVVSNHLWKYGLFDNKYKDIAEIIYSSIIYLP